MSIKDKVKNADTNSCPAVAHFENEKMFIAPRGGRCYVGQRKDAYDVETRLIKSYYSWMLPQEVAKLNKHRTMMEGKKRVDMFDKWYTSPHATRYSEIQFVPYKDTPPKLPEGTLNLYTGFAVKPVNHGIKYLRIIHLIRHFTGGNEQHFKWVLDWIAFNFQNPHKKAEVAIVLRGTEGTGKGLLGRLFLLIHGMHAAALTNPDHVVGRFNAHLETLVFAVLTEAFFAGDAKTNGALKALLTDTELMIERKFQDAEPSRNYLNCLMTTNEDFAVPAGATARRYAVFDANKVEGVTHLVTDSFSFLVENEYGEQEKITFLEGASFDCGKWEGTELLKVAEPNLIPVSHFYTELAQEVERKEVLEQFLFDVLSRDIADYRPNAAIPKTEALLEQKLHTLKQDSVGCWLYDLADIHQNEVVITCFEKDGKVAHYPADKGVPNAILHKSYLDWCHASKQSHFKIEHQTGFVKRLKKLMPLANAVWVGGERGLSFNYFSLDYALKTLGVK